MKRWNEDCTSETAQCKCEPNPTQSRRRVSGIQEIVNFNTALEAKRLAGSALVLPPRSTRSSPQALHVLFQVQAFILCIPARIFICPHLSLSFSQQLGLLCLDAETEDSGAIERRVAREEKAGREADPRALHWGRNEEAVFRLKGSGFCLVSGGEKVLVNTRTRQGQTNKKKMFWQEEKVHNE